MIPASIYKRIIHNVLKFMIPAYFVGEKLNGRKIH